MSICFEHEDKMCVLILNEHDPLTKEDGQLFYDTLDGLLTYANERLNIVDRKKVTLRSDSRAELDDGARVSERLWLNRHLVDEYVERNPYSVPESQLEAAGPWRHALRDAFIVVNADKDHLLVMNDDAIFNVNKLERDADCHVRAIPSLALLTLLPFKGAIVTDSKFIHLDDNMDDELIPDVAQAAKDRTRSGVVTGAKQLVAYSEKAGDWNRVPECWQRGIDYALGLHHVPGYGASEVK